MKAICLFTNKFPYGKGETYLETEIENYSDVEEFYIFSLNTNRELLNQKIREIPSNIDVVPAIFKKSYIYLFYCIYALGDWNFYKELFKIGKSKKYILKKVISLLIYISRSYCEAKQLQNTVEQIKNREIVFYIYRFEYQPYVAYLLKKRVKKKDIKIIARAHRYDLYEERRKIKYIPMREIVLDELEKVFPCSKNGEDYLKMKFPRYVKKIETRYLGTRHIGNGLPTQQEEQISLISCSNIVEVKRIDKIIDVLSSIKDIRIKWIHYGDGILRNEIEKYAKQKLNNNCIYIFKGHILNKELMETYQKEKINFFINLSDSEGLPVSIMEAMSFGIPCIATDVGGTSEIVIDKYNGLLIKKEETIENIKDKIENLFKMSSAEYELMRNNAKRTWSNKFNAEKNYQIFATEIKKM